MLLESEQKKKLVARIAYSVVLIEAKMSSRLSICFPKRSSLMLGTHRRTP
jgi:hypothetical protein